MSKSWWVAAGSAAALATAALVVASGAPEEPDGTIVLVSGNGGRHDAPLYFELKGTPVRGLFPGSVKQMRITVRNPLGFRLIVQSLSAEVSSTDRRGCRAASENLQVRPYVGNLPVTVAASGSTDLGGAIPVAMPLGAAQRCAGARFTISISGIGRRAA